MTTQELIDCGLFVLVNAGSDSSRSITTPFCCDLLSVAMGKAPAGCAWVTVMGNVNTLAVASLTEAACVIMAEGCVLDDAAISKAEKEGITVLKTDRSIFEAALAVFNKINDKSDV